MTRSSTIFKVILALAAAGALLTGGCDESDRVVGSPSGTVEGNGIVVDDPRGIGNCTRVDLQGVGRLYIQQGAREELVVRAEENLMEFLHTDVQSGELLIWKDGITLLNTRPIEYHLTVVDLERIALTGAGGIEGANLDTGPLVVSLTGTGDIDLFNLNATTVKVDVSGVGDVSTSGAVQDQTINLRSFGSYDARELDSATAEVVIANMGSATVRVSERLDATISGSGSVYYLGDPVVTSNVSGSGDVVRIGT